jgi:peptide/nickel transport system substrate-binding protein
MSSHTLLLIDCSGQEVRVLIQGDLTVNEGGRVALERAFSPRPTLICSEHSGGSMMTRFKGAIGGLAIGVLISLAGPADAENVLRWASVGGARSFDPHAHNETPTKAQLNQVYEKLLDLDSDLQLVPALAIAWRLIDPTTWEFELRPNVRFHDGTPFTAADVAFSIARASSEVPGASFARYTESIVDVRVIDLHRVRIQTKSPDPALPVAMSPIYVMSERWAKAHDVGLPTKGVSKEKYASRHANGTGPFILKRFEQSGRVAMVSNPDWWGFERYPHNIDRIEFTPIADPEQRLAALRRGNLELLNDPPFSAIDEIEGIQDLKLARATEPRVIFLGLDQSRAELRSSDIKGKNPFADKRVRRAVYQAIDIEAIRDNVMDGLAIPAGMLIAPGLNGYAPDLDQRLPYDPEAAKDLLAAAGYPEGFGVTLDCTDNSNMTNDEAICRAIARQLSEVGIAVAVNAQSKDVIYPKIDNRESDFYLDSFAATTLDSHEVFINHYRTKAGLNLSGYSNPRVDELIETIGETMVTYARDALIEEVWKIVLEDIVYIPLHRQDIVWAMRDSLDIPVNPFNRPQFREARFK